MAHQGAWPEGFRLFRHYLSCGAQAALLSEIDAKLKEAPLFRPVMPRHGRPFSVRMSNFGPLGWVSDRAGYRYQKTHPVTGHPWPKIPERLLDIWRGTAAYPAPPEACLVNYYAAGARLGLHRDSDEIDQTAPVVSVSLGCPAIFRLGGLRRNDPVCSITLEPGDVAVMGRTSRLCYHGVSRILEKRDSLFQEGGRFNLTLRRVTEPTSHQRQEPPP